MDPWKYTDVHSPAVPGLWRALYPAAREAVVALVIPILRDEPDIERVTFSYRLLRRVEEAHARAKTDADRLLLERVVKLLKPDPSVAMELLTRLRERADFQTLLARPASAGTR